LTIGATVNLGASSSVVSFSNIICQPKKPFPEPMAIGNNLVMRDIMISANKEG
jgi:hypothetical protein